MLIKAFLELPGVMMEPINLKWRICTLPKRHQEDFILRDSAATFHIFAMEMHLHKVLMRFEGRGGVFN